MKLRASPERSVSPTNWRSDRKRHRTTTTVALAAIIALWGGSVFASHDANTIHACKDGTNGLLRQVDDPANCREKETAVEWNVVGPQGEQGIQGIQGEKGDKGDTGAQGANGTDGIDGVDGQDGEDGKTVLNGTTAPDEALGTLEDFYLNTATSTLYGPKTDSGWGAGTSLVGPAGTDGADGIMTAVVRTNENLNARHAAVGCIVGEEIATGGGGWQIPFGSGGAMVMSIPQRFNGTVPNGWVVSFEDLSDTTAYAVCVPVS